MPSFDVVSEVDMHELTNAVDQANREVTTRFDFKGSDAKFEQSGNEITLSGTGEFQLQQMMEILQKKMLKTKFSPHKSTLRIPSPLKRFG